MLIVENKKTQPGNRPPSKSDRDYKGGSLPGCNSPRAKEAYPCQDKAT